MLCVERIVYSLPVKNKNYMGGGVSYSLPISLYHHITISSQHELTTLCDNVMLAAEYNES